MSNMSYCAFENTSRDLFDAKDKVEQIMNDNEMIKEMSQYEARGLDDLLVAAKEIVELEEQITTILENYYEQS